MNRSKTNWSPVLMVIGALLGMALMKAAFRDGSSSDTLSDKTIKTMHSSCVKAATDVPSWLREDFCTCTIQRITKRLTKNQLLNEPQKHMEVIERVRAECMHHLGI
jgi:hypothetical protein